jgi:hypothetical protein
MNRSRVAGWQHHAMSDCVIQSGDIVDNRWLLRNKCNRTGTGGRCCLFHVCSIVASKQSKAKQPLVAQDKTTFFGHYTFMVHIMHRSPPPRSWLACMHTISGRHWLSSAMIRNCKIRMKEESFRQSTILYEREEVFVDCWIVNAREWSNAHGWDSHDELAVAHFFHSSWLAGLRQRRLHRGKWMKRFGGPR